MRELHDQKRTDLVEAVAWNKEGEPTLFRLFQAGYDYLGAIMRRNAAARIAAGEGEWVQPPSRVDLIKKEETHAPEPASGWARHPQAAPLDS